MSEHMLERAVLAAIRNAWQAARLSRNAKNSNDDMAKAVAYAIAIIVPIHTAVVEGAVREAVAARKESSP